MATADYLLVMKDVKGESKDTKYKDAVEIQSFSWGETNQGSQAFGGGGGTGKVQPQDVHFSAVLTGGGPTLLQSCASGKHYDEVKFYCRKAGSEQQEYAVFTFKDCFVSSFQLAGSTGDVLPIMQFSLSVGAIKLEYSQQDEKGGLVGKVPGGWSFKENKVFA